MYLRDKCFPVGSVHSGISCVQNKGCFGLETRVIIKISKKNDTSYETQGFFIRKKQKTIFFLKKKIPKWQTQKKVIFQNRQFSIFLVKISWIGPWVSRIE